MAAYSVDNLAEAVTQALSEYSEEVLEATKKEVRNVAKQTVAELRDSSPKKTGEYAKGWKSKVQHESRNDIRITVYNAKKPQLTHLLENGYALRNGGRFTGIPHLRIAEQNAIQKLGGRLKVVLNK